MAADFVIDTGLGVVFSSGTGPLTYADIAGHMNRLTADARFRPDFRQIIDFRNAIPVEITSAEVLQLAEREIYGPGSRRAFVVGSDLQFGLCRMFGAHREAAGEPTIRIFRDMTKAIAWIEVPAEVAQQAFKALAVSMGGKTAPPESPRQSAG